MNYVKWLLLKGTQKVWQTASGSAKAVMKFVVAMKPVDEESVQGRP
jgi:hypothetical protein